jgi:hypothetical protein
MLEKVDASIPVTAAALVNGKALPRTPSNLDFEE